MNFEETGAILRAEREKRNLSVEDVADQLKISPRQIRALESGEIDSLPHPAYARGFIRSYASWLGLTPEELRGEAKGEGGEASPLSMESQPGKNKGHKGVWMLFFLVLLGVAFYYAWTRNFWDLFEKTSGESAQFSSSLPTAEEFLAKKNEKELPQTAQNQSIQLEEKDASIASPVDIPSPVASPKKGETQSPEVAETPPASPVAETAQESRPEAQVPLPENHKLIITAIEECWVHSNSDKTDTRQFSLRKGDTFALTFVETLELKLGNAGGVRLRYDGKDMPSPGTSGQVKTIMFPPEE